MTDLGEPIELPPEGEGHELPGPVSDPIRAGEIPAPLKYIRPELASEQPAPVDVVFGSGQGLGEGAGRKRDGTIPTEPSGTDTPRGDHIRAAARLEAALAELRDAYRLASDREFEVRELMPEAFGDDVNVPAALGLRWLSKQNSALPAGDAEVSRQEVRAYLERL